MGDQIVKSVMSRGSPRSSLAYKAVDTTNVHPGATMTLIIIIIIIIIIIN